MNLEEMLGDIEYSLRKESAHWAALLWRVEQMSIRLEILTARMRGCHEDTGHHVLLGEAEAFVAEGKETVADLRRLLGAA